jgi:hypothetical protein
MAIDLKNIFHFFSAYPRATFGGSAVANVELLFLVYDSHSTLYIVQISSYNGLLSLRSSSLHASCYMLTGCYCITRYVNVQRAIITSTVAMFTMRDSELLAACSSVTRLFKLLWTKLA